MPLPQIAFVHNDSTAPYLLEVRNGIAAHQRVNPPWQFHFAELRHFRTGSRYRFDGIIAYIGENTPLAKAFKETGVPVVDIGPEIMRAGDRAGLPHVLPDDVEVGKTAAAYFLARGFTRFAYVAAGNTPFSERRRTGFQQILADAGHEILAYQTAKPWWSIEAQEAPLQRWLKALPRPAALLVADDKVGTTVLAACAEMAIRVPEDFAILGVNDESGTCEMLKPSLSSIPLDGRGAGYQAAALLSRLMAGEAPPKSPLLIAPRPVVTRQSSDIMCTADELVAQALQFIGLHARQPISVTDVVEHVLISRRVLEVRFLKAVGRTIGQEIMRVHLDRAGALLRDTDLSVPEIAATSGFSTQQWFSAVYHKKTGETPTEYRRRFQRR